MTQLVQFVLLFAACTAMTLSMNRHRRDVGLDAITPFGRLLARSGATVLFVGSLAFAVSVRGWGVGTTEWTSIFGLCAIVLALALNYRSLGGQGRT